MLQPCPTNRFTTLINTTTTNTNTDMSCYPKILQNVSPRPIWCPRLSGETSESSRAKDGCITWSTSQSHTSCCFGALYPIRSLKDESLWSFKGTAPTQSPQNSSSKTEVMLAVFNTALCGRDTLQWADHAGPEEGFLCSWTVDVERRRRRRRRRGTKPNFGGRASGGIVMTATHRLPDISNWLTLRVFTYLSNLLNLLG